MHERSLCAVSAVAIVALRGMPALAQVPEPPTEAAAPDAPLQEIVVSGTRLQASGFTAPTPVTVIGEAQFSTRGAGAIQDVLAEMPSFHGIFGSTQTTGGAYTVGQGILDLRGLDATRTLVLVNGRRHVPNNADGTLDTNMIPTGLIDHVDVVTGGASAAYGSDAVAGVVNFVLNEKLEGIKGTVQYGASQRSDAEELVVNFASGTRFADDRGHVIFGLDYGHGEPSGTEYSRGWGKKETALISLPASRQAGLPATYLTDNQRIAIPPGSLVVSCARGAVPLFGAACPIGGLTFGDEGQPTPFVFGSPRGFLQMAGGDNAGYNQYRNQYLKVGMERVAALGHATFDFTDTLTGYADLSAGGSTVDSRTTDYFNFGTIIVQRDNPFIPAALAAQMDSNDITRFNLSRLNYAQQDGVNVRNKDDFWQSEVGLRGEAFDDWNWNVSYAHGESRTRYRPHGVTILPNYFAALYVVEDAAGNPACGPIASNPMFAAMSPAQRAAFAPLVASGCVPFNPFGPNAESRAAIDYVAPDYIESETAYQRDSAAVNLTGSPFSSWAGEVSLAVGAEWREDEVTVSSDPYTTALIQASAFFAGSPQPPGQGAVSVREGYAEIGLPLARDLPLLRALDLNAAGRVTDYSTSGSVSTWKLGGTWDITDGMRFRVTRSRDIRAANVSELYLRGPDLLYTVANPITGVSGQVNGAIVNNESLRPEKANTWTIGLVLDPQWQWARGFQASFDYYSITIDGVISSLSADTVVKGYYLGGRQDYARYFTFDPTVPAGFSRVDRPLENLNSQEVKGLDINLDYEAPIEHIGLPGSLKLSAIGSYLEQHETFDSSGASLGEMAGVIPRWGWNGSIKYQLNKFSTTLTVRYNSSLRYNVQLTGPDSPAYDPASPTSISKNLFPSATYFNLQAQYEIRDDWVLYGTVDNLFDKDPPAGSFAMLQGVGSTASRLGAPYDNIGRYFRVGVRAAF